MIESNNPEIDVEKLMKRVKAEAKTYRAQATSNTEGKEGKNKWEPQLVALHSQHFREDENRLSEFIGNLDIAEEHLNTADFFSQAPQKFPDKLDRFPFTLSRGLQKFLLKIYGFLFKKQRVVNASLGHSIREIIRFSQVATSEFQQALQKQTATSEFQQVLQNQVNQLGLDLSSFQKLFNEEVGALHDSNRSTQESSGLISETNELILEFQESLRRSNQQLGEQLQAANLLITQLQQELSAVQDQFHSFQQEQASNNGQLQEDLYAVRDQFYSLQKEQARNNSYIKTDLILHKRLMSNLLETGHSQPDELKGSNEHVTIQKENLMDTVYFKLEEQFRGSYEAIIQRLEPYIQLLENANISSLDSDLLDLGCGRGEWLELLQQSGYSAKGIDTNMVMVEVARNRGLEVLHQDAIDYLSKLPDNHLAAVTGFHIIEHLQFPVLVYLLGEVARVLKPGGLVIFETPNPQNVLVGTNNFYIDPTHLKPLPTLLSKFLLEQTGFVNVEISNLHPYDVSHHLKDGEVAERFNSYFYGPQDYAVIGHKL